MVTEGTLEWWIKVDRGYSYWAGVLHDGAANNWWGDGALIFTTDIAGGDVTWPGSTWLYVRDSDILLMMGTRMYGGYITSESLSNSFRFGEWHAIGISFGSGGHQIMVDGQLVVSDPTKTQPLGSGGNFSAPVDIPTIGESVSGFFGNNYYEGGFEGMVDRFRISSSQSDWYLALGLTRPLQIITQPQSQLGYWGKSVSFSVTATNGTSPYTYQWVKDQIPILDATNSLLVLTNLQMTNAGVYVAVVTDAASKTTNSQPATLTMNPAGVGIALYAGVAIEGVVGQTYGVQMTSDLSNTNSWAGVANATLTTPTQIWYDSQPETRPQRYYRVVPGPIAIP